MRCRLDRRGETVLGQNSGEHLSALLGCGREHRLAVRADEGFDAHPGELGDRLRPELGLEMAKGGRGQRVVGLPELRSSGFGEREDLRRSPSAASTNRSVGRPIRRSDHAGHDQRIQVATHRRRGQAKPLSEDVNRGRTTLEQQADQPIPGRRDRLSAGGSGRSGFHKTIVP